MDIIRQKIAARRQTFPKLESRYYIIKELGSGGTSTVYLAKDKKDNQIYALKVMPFDYNVIEEDSDGDFESFTLNNVMSVDAEMNLMKLISAAPHCHRGIVCYYEYNRYTYHNLPVFVIQMEFVPGQELFDVMMMQPGISKRLSENEVINYAIPILQTLAYLHRREISHRDIKLENIIITVNGPVIVDVGFACSVSQRNNVRICQGLPGTYDYQSPEMVKGTVQKNPSLWIFSDLWAFGVCLYIMLRGAPPFEGSTLDELDYEILYTEPEPIKIQNSRLKTVMWSLLEKNPYERMSAREAYQTLSGELD